MPDLFEIFRAYPLLFVLLVFLPLGGGAVGAYLGYDNLRERLATERHRERVETSLDQLKTPVEALRRYEAQLSADAQTDEALRLVISQYDQLRGTINNQSRLSGTENPQDRIASGDQIIESMRSILGRTQTIPGPSGRALVIKTAPNEFKVIFAVPMRIAPDLQFPSLPAGVTPHVIEKSNIGFTVIFTPASIPIETFGLIASAEL